MAATDLLDLPNARLAIRSLATDNTNNTDLTTVYIPAVTAPVEDMIGPVVIRSFTEWRDGGTASIALDRRPITAVTSVLESYGNFTRTLTQQPLDGSPFDAYGYTLDADAGIIFRRATGRSVEFAPGRQNIKIAYSAGMVADTASVVSSLPTVLLAARIILRQMWQADQQGTGQGRQIGNGSGVDLDMMATPTGFLIPRRAYELLHALSNVPGMS